MLKHLYRFLHPKFQTLFLDYPVDFAPRYGQGKPPHSELYNIINEHRDEYQDFLEQILQFKDVFFQIKDARQTIDKVQPAWNNGFLPGLDIVSLYTMLAVHRPQKYIEIGSGNSTKVAHKAKKEQQLTTQIVSIDPQPRTEIDQLADLVIRQAFETAQYPIVEQLEAKDILFIDNSHRILPNSDSTVFFLEVLPRLKKGVIVHIHDIYLPYDYPQFMCDRFYSEQYALAAFLLANPHKYRPILPNYFISEDTGLAASLAPLWQHPNTQNVEQHGGSFWLQIAE